MGKPIVRTEIQHVVGLKVVAAMEHDGRGDDPISQFLLKFDDGSVLVVSARACYGYDAWPTLQPEITDECQRALDGMTP